MLWGSERMSKATRTERCCPRDLSQTLKVFKCLWRNPLHSPILCSQCYGDCPSVCFRSILCLYAMQCLDVGKGVGTSCMQDALKESKPYTNISICTVWVCQHSDTLINTWHCHTKRSRWELSETLTGNVQSSYTFLNFEVLKLYPYWLAG